MGADKKNIGAVMAILFKITLATNYFALGKKVVATPARPFRRGLHRLTRKKFLIFCAISVSVAIFFAAQQQTVKYNTTTFLL
jgi:hypothetical protein